MATFTVTVPDAAVPRVTAAVGWKISLRDVNNLPRDATAPEVKQYIIDSLKAVVRDYEVQVALESARSGAADLPAT